MQSVGCKMETNKADSNSTEFADIVAKLCYDKYMSLPKTGKPCVVKDTCNGKGQWTLLAGIVKAERWSRDCNCVKDLTAEVVSLGTGSKCIGKSKMSPSGDILNDSHSEVIARRGFIRYLYNEILATYRTGSSEVFQCFSNGKCVLRDDITFHFFTSHTPCGDASIIPKSRLIVDDVGSCFEYKEMTTASSERCNIGESVVMGETVQGENDSTLEAGIGGKRKANVIENCYAVQGRKCFKTDTNGAALDVGKSDECPHHLERSDIHRTGAKCLALESLQDSHFPGTDYHVVGALRTKPGRGDPTLSLSCSDKLSRWNVVGAQGALVSVLVNRPIYFQSITVGAECPFSETVLRRAVVGRLISRATQSQDKLCVDNSLSLPLGYTVTDPLLLQSTLPFIHARDSSGEKQPCPSSIVWCKVSERALEVAVDGKKQGVTKKVAHTSAGRLQICKKELLRQFVIVCSSIPNPTLHFPIIFKCNDIIGDRSELEAWLSQLSYKQLKNLAEDYQLAWNTVRAACFPSWKRKCGSFIGFCFRD
ncbi:tRNA-specific adenosine deaminase 1 [Periplaneta americana]|uniref:tRNA-specific adenosine deaminase 1 n=1 Tax=Periplaneta americana TaxID=6978 RepID=UPI0037E91C09